MLNLLTPVPDEELTAVLTAALRAQGGQLTRHTECFMATLAAERIVEWLASEGIVAVRVPQRVPLRD